MARAHGYMLHGYKYENSMHNSPIKIETRAICSTAAIAMTKNIKTISLVMGAYIGCVSTRTVPERSFDI